MLSICIVPLRTLHEEGLPCPGGKDLAGTSILPRVALAIADCRGASRVRREHMCVTREFRLEKAGIRQRRDNLIRFLSQKRRPRLAEARANRRWDKLRPMQQFGPPKYVLCKTSSCLHDLCYFVLDLGSR